MMLDLSLLMDMLTKAKLPETLAVNNAQAMAPTGLFSDMAMPNVTNPGMAVTSPLVQFNQDPAQIPSTLFQSMPNVDLAAGAKAAAGNVDPMQMAQLAGLFSREEPRSAPGAGIVRGQQYQGANPWSYMRQR